MFFEFAPAITGSVGNEPLCQTSWNGVKSVTVDPLYVILAVTDPVNALVPFVGSQTALGDGVNVTTGYTRVWVIVASAVAKQPVVVLVAFTV